MSLKRFTAPLTAAVLVLGACAEEEGPAVEASSRAAESAADTTAGAPAAGPGELMPINRSEVRGRAEAVRDGNDLVVEVEAQGLEPGATYASFLHQGRCAEGGPVQVPVGRILADENGTGSVGLRVEANRAPAGGELFVQVHAPDDQPVACADIGPGEPEA